MAALIEEHHLTMHDLKSLIAKGMKLDQVNAEGQTLLMLVALHNHDPNVSKMVLTLLEEGNGAAVDLKGDNALIYALHNTSFNLNLVKELLHLAGDDILFRVDVLEQEADEEFVEFLSSVIPIAVGNGADPFGKKNGGTLFFELAEISTNTSEDISPIFNALAKVAKAKSPSELASLLDELNPSYSEGESPLVALTVSIRVGDVRFVEELLKAGANPSKAEYVEIDTTPEIVSLMKRYKNSYTAKSTALAPPPKKGRTAVRAPPTTEAEPAPRARGSTRRTCTGSCRFRRRLMVVLPFSRLAQRKEKLVESQQLAEVSVECTRPSKQAIVV